MFFTSAKILSYFLTLPNAAVFAVIVLLPGLWTRWRSAVRILMTAAVAFLALCAFSPLGSVLLRPLEDRFSRPVLAQSPTGVIVLGGVTDEVLTVARDGVSLTAGAERLTEAVALQRRFPNLRLVFTGGSGRLEPTSITEAAAARRFWSEMGVPAGQMAFEDRSRDTWENAIFTKEMLQIGPGETWLLVTSAAHMPRSVGIFRKIGFPVVPWPVDYRTTGTNADFHGWRNASDMFEALAVASHEWIGLIAYYLAGKTSALFPAPETQAASSSNR